MNKWFSREIESDGTDLADQVVGRKSWGLIGKAVSVVWPPMDATITSDARFAERAKIRQARAMSPWMKFRAGADLFEEACLWTLAGIKAQFPEFTELQRREELRRRLESGERTSR